MHFDPQAGHKGKERAPVHSWLLLTLPQKLIPELSSEYLTSNHGLVCSPEALGHP